MATADKGQNERSLSLIYHDNLIAGVLSFPMLAILMSFRSYGGCRHVGLIVKKTSKLTTILK